MQHAFFAPVMLIGCHDEGQVQVQEGGDPWVKVQGQECTCLCTAGTAVGRQGAVLL